MKKRYLLAVIILLLFAATPKVFAVSLGAAEMYNVFVFETFKSSNAFIGGRVAAGKDISLTSVQVGGQLQDDTSGGTDTLVAGGNLRAVNGSIVTGNIIAGGDADVKSFGMPNGTAVTGSADLPVDFDREKDYLTGLSGQLSSMAANGTVEYKYNGGIYLTEDPGSPIQVFDLDGDLLSSAHTFKFQDESVDIPVDATVIFNVSGENVSMKNFSMGGFSSSLGSNYDNVLFNFYEATALDFSSIHIFGSILAPYAEVKANNGQLSGTLVANSWKGGMTLNNLPFDSGDQPSQVPEPGTLALLSLGLLGMAGFLRKKS